MENPIKRYETRLELIKAVLRNSTIISDHDDLKNVAKQVLFFEKFLDNSLSDDPQTQRDVPPNDPPPPPHS